MTTNTVPYASNGMTELPWIATARTQLGIKEIPGAKHEPQILQYWKDIGINWGTTDEIAWCAAFVGAMLKRTGMDFLPTGMARGYMDFVKVLKKGQILKQPAYGAIGVMWTGSKTGTQGHVGFVVGQDANNPDRILLLAGNQGNQVSIASFPKSQFLGFIWPNLAPTAARYELPKIPYKGAITTNTR